MSFSPKILPALALAFALSPLAAQARSDRNPGPAQYYLAPLHNDSAVQKPVRVSEVTPSNATIDNPTTVYSGVTANLFPNSLGG
jgi:hypothetical protein